MNVHSTLPRCAGQRNWCRPRVSGLLSARPRNALAVQRAAVVQLLAEFVQFSQLGDQAINALLQWNCITGL